MVLELHWQHCAECDGSYCSTTLSPIPLKQAKLAERVTGNNPKYCICADKNPSRKYSQYEKTTERKASSKAISEFINEDIYFYDLYITYNNFHQDLPMNQAIY